MLELKIVLDTKAFPMSNALVNKSKSAVTDAGNAPRRLFPNMTVYELSNALVNAGADQAEKIRLAMRQRDPMSADYVKPFKTPQIVGNFTLKA